MRAAQAFGQLGVGPGPAKVNLARQADISLTPAPIPCSTYVLMNASSETKVERASGMLAEAAGIMLGAMRTLSSKLEAAETPQDAAELALALQRVNRGLRQTLLLDSRLEAEAQAAVQKRNAEAEKAREAAVAERKLRVRLAVGRKAYEACDSREDADDLIAELDDCLDDYVRGHFDELSIEALIALLLRDLGLPVPEEAAAAEAPSAPAAPEPAPPAPLRLVQQPDLGWSPAPNSS